MRFKDFKQPKSVEVFGRRVKVIFDKKKLTTEGSLGEYHVLENKIIIDDTLPIEQQVVCLYHEMAHVLLDRTGVRYSGALAPEIEEIIVENIAQFIVSHFFTK